MLLYTLNHVDVSRGLVTTIHTDMCPEWRRTFTAIMQAGKDLYNRYSIQNPEMPTEISHCLWQNGGIVSCNTIKTAPSKSLHVHCSSLFSPLIRS